MTDSRPLHVRIKALAHRYDAMASGRLKNSAPSLQDAQNTADTAATLHEAADALVGARPPASFRRSWPYAVVMPDNSATPGGHNVRQPDGMVVFSEPVSQPVAQQACYALNQTWDDAASPRDPETSFT
jgi:hypothetical protein